MASIRKNAFPFSDLDYESHLFTIYEFQNGPIVYDQNRLSNLLFNPLFLVRWSQTSCGKVVM